MFLQPVKCITNINRYFNIILLLINHNISLYNGVIACLLHLPGCLDPLPCKIQRTPAILRIEMIEYFHELFTVLPWRVIVEEVELRYALAVKSPALLLLSGSDARLARLRRGISSLR